MDYAFLPPEINSARMYSGPGPNSMLVAAASWDALAAELASAAENYGSVIARLTGMHWWGPASTSMLAMSAPYVEWLERTAAQTKQTATQARAAAAAFEQAHAMTVPPALVTANRAELKALIASNLLGQNTAAIAAIEAQYAEMWAQDAAAMYGYATTSAAARQLTPFSSPQQTTNPAGLAAQNAAVTQAATNSAGNTPTALSQLSSFLSQAVEAPTGWPNILPDDFTILDGIFAAYATVGVTQDIESICAGIIGAENNLGLLGAPVRIRRSWRRARSGSMRHSVRQKKALLRACTMRYSRVPAGRVRSGRCPYHRPGPRPRAPRSRRCRAPA